MNSTCLLCASWLGVKESAREFLLSGISLYVGEVAIKQTLAWRQVAVSRKKWIVWYKWQVIVDRWHLGHALGLTAFQLGESFRAATFRIQYTT